MKIYVRNKLDHEVVERKVGAGTFTIPAGGRVEVQDIVGEHKLPQKKTLAYIVNGALEVAQSIVSDFGQPGLEIEMEDDDGEVFLAAEPSVIVGDIKKEVEAIEKEVATPVVSFIDRILHKQ